MATNTTPRQDVPMKDSNPPVVRETKQRRTKTRRRDEFRGKITGFIDVARGDGDVIGFSETVFEGNAEHRIEPAQAASPRRKTRKQEKRYAEEEGDFESGSSDDDGHSGSVFYGEINGFVKEARTPGTAIAMKKVTYVGTSNTEQPMIDSRGAIPRAQQQLRSQEEIDLMESRNIMRGLNLNQNREPMKIRANNFPKTTEMQHAQNFADSRPGDAFDMNAITKEFHGLSAEMRRFITLQQRTSVDSEEDRKRPLGTRSTEEDDQM